METKQEFRLPKTTVLDEFSTWPNQKTCKKSQIFQAILETSNTLALRQKVNPQLIETYCYA